MKLLTPMARTLLNAIQQRLVVAGRADPDPGVDEDLVGGDASAVNGLAGSSLRVEPLLGTPPRQPRPGDAAMPGADAAVFGGAHRACRARSQLMELDGNLRRARAAVEQRAWLAACAAYADADEVVSLQAQDLESWGLGAFLIGLDERSDAIRERAHYAFLEAGDADGAARVAFWLGLTLVMRGQSARGRGWFQRLRAAHTDEAFAASVWRGYERLNDGMSALFAGEYERSRTLLAEAREIADRHGDVDLQLLARNGHGQALLALGKSIDGMAELDEVMVLATTGTANLQTVGQVYCAVILVCRSCLDIARSAEWTEVLSRWCDSQPDLVPYRGQCLVHRSEVLQLLGQWSDAVEQVEAVLGHLDSRRDDAAAGMAWYQRGDLHRMHGEFDAAERAYRAALGAGRDPQPGLALLRLAQGRTETAFLSLRRALEESRLPFARAQLLPAMVETGLAAGQFDVAELAAAELSEAAARLNSSFLRAVAGTARGAVALASGEAAQALGSLREAQAEWTRLNAPYETARCRVLIAQACRGLDDLETAGLEGEAARTLFADLGAHHDRDRLDERKRPRGQTPGGLTPREVEVLRLVATGATNRDIAGRLVLSERTVARHVANIFVKIGVSARAAATAYAYDHNLL